MNGFVINDREQEYLKVKSLPKIKYANGSVGARLTLMVWGGCLPVRDFKGIEWMYTDDLCEPGKNRYTCGFFRVQMLCSDEEKMNEGMGRVG